MTARPWFGQSRVAPALTAAWFCPFDDALALAHAVPGGSGTCFWLGTVMAESKGSYGFSSVEHRSLQAGEGIAVRGYPPPSATMIPGDSPQARGWGICPGATSLRTSPGITLGHQGWKWGSPPVPLSALGTPFLDTGGGRVSPGVTNRPRDAPLDTRHRDGDPPQCHCSPWGHPSGTRGGDGGSPSVPPWVPSKCHHFPRDPSWAPGMEMEIPPWYHSPSWGPPLSHQGWGRPPRVPPPILGSSLGYWGQRQGIPPTL